MKKILIICTGNSCRSQMAEGWLRFLTPNYYIYSAGTNPEPVNKYAVLVMKKVGIDISNHTSNNVHDYLDISFDYIITVCDSAKEKCPVFSGNGHMIHHSFIDPAKARGSEEELNDIYTAVRDDIKQYLESFVKCYLK